MFSWPGQETWSRLPTSCPVQLIGSRIEPVVITEADVLAGTKDLGNIEVNCRVGPRLGEAMQLDRFTDLQGQDFSIQDLRNRNVLLHVWASWSEPSLAGMPAIQRLREGARDEQLVIIGINIDREAAKAQAFSEARDWKWRQYYVGDRSSLTQQLAISGLPGYFLIGPDGKLKNAPPSVQAISRYRLRARPCWEVGAEPRGTSILMSRITNPCCGVFFQRRLHFLPAVSRSYPISPRARVVLATENALPGLRPGQSYGDWARKNRDLRAWR